MSSFLNNFPAAVRRLLLLLLLLPPLLGPASVVTASYAGWAANYSGSDNGLPSSTSAAPTTASTPYWLASINHQGLAPFAGPAYPVFRNVKDFGAKGVGHAIGASSSS